MCLKICRKNKMNLSYYSSILENKQNNRNELHRNSSIELLRIILMCHIIWGHFYSQTSMELSYAHVILRTVFSNSARIATATFFIITAYYCNIEDSINKIVTKVVKIYFQYSITSFLGCLCFGHFKEGILYGLFPLVINPSWYVSCYIYFLLLLPILNSFVSHFAKIKSYSTYIGIVLFGSSMLYIIVYRDFPTDDFWHLLLVFSVVYLLVKAYRNEIDYICSNKKIALYTMVVYLLYLSTLLVGTILDFNMLLKILKNVQVELLMLPVWIVAIMIVMAFINREFHSKIINNISSGVMCAYIIHSLPCVIPHLWDGVFMADRIKGFLKDSLIGGFVYLLFLAVSLILVGCLINWATNALFYILLHFAVKISCYFRLDKAI